MYKYGIFDFIEQLIVGKIFSYSEKHLLDHKEPIEEYRDYLY
jgi:hypothetical protein